MQTGPWLLVLDEAAHFAGPYLEKAPECKDQLNMEAKVRQ